MINQRKIHEQSAIKSLLVKYTKKKKNDFNSDLAIALLLDNILRYKVFNLKLKKTLEKHTSKNIPDKSILRKNYVDCTYIQAYIHIYKLRSWTLKFGYQRRDHGYRRTLCRQCYCNF